MVGVGLRLGSAAVSTAHCGFLFGDPAVEPTGPVPVNRTNDKRQHPPATVSKHIKTTDAQGSERWLNEMKRCAWLGRYGMVGTYGMAPVWGTQAGESPGSGALPDAHLPDAHTNTAGASKTGCFASRQQAEI
jgi:hypothetical protein